MLHEVKSFVSLLINFGIKILFGGPYIAKINLVIRFKIIVVASDPMILLLIYMLRISQLLREDLTINRSSYSSSI